MFSFLAHGRKKSAKNASLIRKLPAARCADCTNRVHPLVDGLHSIDFQDDKSPAFLLTLKMKGVKTTSFFDSF